MESEAWSHQSKILPRPIKISPIIENVNRYHYMPNCDNNCSDNSYEKSTYNNLQPVKHQNYECKDNPLLRKNYPEALSFPPPYATIVANNFTIPNIVQQPFRVQPFPSGGFTPRMGCPRPTHQSNNRRTLFEHHVTGPFQVVNRIGGPQRSRGFPRARRALSFPDNSTNGNPNAEPLGNNNFHNYSASQPSTSTRRNGGSKKLKARTSVATRPQILARIESDTSEDSDEENRRTFEIGVIPAPKKKSFGIQFQKLIKEALEDEEYLTVNGIYEWLSKRYTMLDCGNDKVKKISIQNSIRHKLTYGKNFTRHPTRGPTGYMWTINKFNRKNLSEKENLYSLDKLNKWNEDRNWTKETLNQDSTIKDNKDELDSAIKSILTYKDFSDETYEKEIVKSAKMVLYGSPSPKVIVELAEPNFPMHDLDQEYCPSNSSLPTSPIMNTLPVLDLPLNKSYEMENFKNTSEAIDFMINLL